MVSSRPWIIIGVGWLAEAPFDPFGILGGWLAEAPFGIFLGGLLGLLLHGCPRSPSATDFAIVPGEKTPVAGLS